MTTRDERFWSKVRKAETCWLWTGTTIRGYGKIQLDKRRWATHRYAYEHLVGPIPAGLELDHLCRTPACVNPAHLEPVTHAENVRRGRAGECWRAKTHCPQGHPYDAANTIVDSRGARRCRACSRAQATTYRARQTTYRVRLKVVPPQRFCRSCKAPLPVRNRSGYCRTPCYDIALRGVSTPCIECGGPLGRGNTSGRCRSCNARRASYAPDSVIEQRRQLRRIGLTTQSKACSVCQETLPLNDFGRDRRAVSGRRSECRSCENVRRRWRREHLRHAAAADADGQAAEGGDAR